MIPLGQGYDLERLASALGNPIQVGLLPAIPYGWAGSGLAVPRGKLRTLLLNLVESLRDDGFSNVFILTPQDAQLELGSAGIALFHPSQHAAPLALPPDAVRDNVILIPVGHTEQHAYHLPMSTDTLIIAAVARSDRAGWTRSTPGRCRSFRTASALTARPSPAR